MHPAERLFNILFGMSAVSWAVFGIALENPEARLSTPRLAAAGLNLCVGILFLARAPVIRHGSPGKIVFALPSLLLGWVAFSVALPPPDWPIHSQVLLAAGLAWAALSFLFLGRSFSILPAVRPIVTRGPYRWLRHPAYLGEFIAILGCSLAPGDPLLAWPAAAAVPLIVLRVVAEERVLKSDPAYVVYSEKVRWRLIPCIW